MSVQTWKRKLSNAEYIYQVYQLNIRLGEILVNKPQKYKTNYTDEIVKTALGALGIDAGQYRALIREKIDGTADGLREMLRASVVPKAVSVLIQVIAVVGLFIVSNLLLRLVFWLLRKVIESVGILRSANRVLGLVLGILLAVLRVLLFVTVVAALLNVSAISQLPVVSAFRIDETYLFRWIHSINPFNFIFG